MLAAEADPMLSEVAEPMLSEVAKPMLSEEEESESESESDSESEGEEEWRRCRLCDCLCRWTFFPSCARRRVAPGVDYDRLPDADAADHHLPAWSLLVGVADGASSSLRVFRLRVARSGRILGRSNDALHVFHDIALAKPPGYTFKAGVAPLASDGRSLCVLHHALQQQPQALQLTLQPQPQPQEMPLPEIEGTTADHCIPISADGHTWALSATPQGHAINTALSLVMRRLVPVSGGGTRWELVRSPFTSPPLHHPLPPWTGRLLQGYAVIPDGKLILVSFLQYGLFLTFHTDSGSWTRVLTDTDNQRSQRYLPILGRAIYVQHHKAVYFLSNNIIYAYNLTYQKDDQGGTQQLKLDLPVQIEFLCPFKPEQGYGLLTRLSSHLMCAVWISLAWVEQCPCKNLHAIVTTFYLHDTQDLAQGGIKALHSTFRRLDMLPNPPAHQHFCFLQYMMDRRSIPPSGLSRSLPVDPASRQQVCSSSHAVPVKPATTTIKKDLIIICQAGSRSLIYQTGAMDDDVKPLEPCYVADVGGCGWHFFQSGSKIHAVSSTGAGMREFSLNKDRQTSERPVRRPSAVPFVMVIRVGQETIALTETLQVYHQTQFNYGSSTSWLRYMADESDVLGRRVVISGYVAVNDESFMVCDAVTCSCLLFDMAAKRWLVVVPLAAFKENPPPPVCIKDLLINGRCVFVDGFIYTCRNGGLAAFELLVVDCSLYLSKPIILPLTRREHCVGEDMCLDYAGKDMDSGANLFYVVQGVYSPPKHGVRITTVKVKTQRTASNKMKPAGIDHMDSVTRFIHNMEAMDTRCCFAIAYSFFCLSTNQLIREYEDQGSVVLQRRGEEEEGLTSSQHVEDRSKLLSCCRHMMKMRSIPPLGLSRSLPVDPASRQHQVCSPSAVVPLKFFF
ncbi:hypothetical protein ACQ4PT_053782 [Festuca glaucescens]